MSADAGLSWSTPTRLDASTPGLTLHTTPDVTPDPVKGGFLITWKHVDAGLGHTKIAVSRARLTPNRTPTMTPAKHLEIAPGWWAASPRFGRGKADSVVLTYTETNGARTRVMRTTLADDGIWQTPKVAYIGEEPAGHYMPHQLEASSDRRVLVFERREPKEPGSRLILLEQ